MNILSVQGTGAILTLALLLLVVLLVHAVKLAKVGWRTLFKKLPPEEPTRSAPKPEPVYFLVERKKKRTKKPKSELSEPKQIEFK